MNQIPFYWSLVGGKIYYDLLSFTTNSSYLVPSYLDSAAFLRTSVDTLRWDLGDGSIVNANGFTHYYTSKADKLVSVKTSLTNNTVTTVNLSYNTVVGTIDLSSFINTGAFYLEYNPSMNKIINPCSSANVFQYRVQSSGLTGTLDVSGLSGLNSAFMVNSNPRLNYILNPNNNLSFVGYSAYECGLIGTLDFSGLTGLGGQISLYNNPSLNYVRNPKSSTVVSIYQVNGCGLIGTLDVSGYSRLGGTFSARANPLLNYILNPSSNENFNSYTVQSCGLMGTLDVSGLSNLGGDFNVAINPSLNYIRHPSTSRTFSAYTANNCGLTGTLDLSSLVGLGGGIQLQYNPSLNYIINPSTSVIITNYQASNCDLIGTFDARNLSNLGGELNLTANPKLNYILNPRSTRSLSYRASDCGLIGTLDISGLTGLGEILYLQQNPSLNAIIFPDSSGIFGDFYIYDCSLFGTLDISKLTRLGGSFNISGNQNLRKLILPDVSRNFTLFNTKNCNLDTVSIDNIFNKLNSYYTVVTPTTNIIINTADGRNSPPTDISLNVDIVNIKSLFTGAGRDASITFNNGLTTLLEFNPGVYVYNFYKSVSTGINYTTSLDCYIDTISNFGTNAKLLIHCGGADLGMRFMNDGNICYYGGGKKWQCPLMPVRTKTRVSLVYNAGLNDVSLYYNGVIQAKNATTESAVTGAAILIGGWDNATATNLQNAALWNYNLNDEHSYAGYPAGNTEDAWVDTIGNWDLSIFVLSAGYDPSLRYIIDGITGV